MANVKVYNTDGKSAGVIELNDAVFGCEYNEALIHQVVVAYLAAQRQGTKSTLTRSEVRGGGVKPWKQKGTGRARQGSIRAPQWIKGGVVFAPKPRDFDKKVNKKMREGALKSALSYKASHDELIVLFELKLPEAKTREMVKVLDNLKLDKKVLFLTAEKDDVVLRASGNLQKVSLTTAGNLNVYDVVSNAKVVATKDAIKKLEEVYAE